VTRYRLLNLSCQTTIRITPSPLGRRRQSVNLSPQHGARGTRRRRPVALEWPQAQVRRFGGAARHPWEQQPERRGAGAGRRRGAGQEATVRERGAFRGASSARGLSRGRLTRADAVLRRAVASRAAHGVGSEGVRRQSSPIACGPRRACPPHSPCSATSGADTFGADVADASGGYGTTAAGGPAEAALRREVGELR
jgi:hypothetical protein